MTQTLDPLTFQADHHTDLWIARRVMEWPDMKEFEPIHDYFHFGGVIIGGDRPTFFRYGTIPDTFQPSSRMEDALEVLRKMKAKGWWYHISGDPKNKDVMVIFGKDKGKEQDDIHSAYAETESMAICRAAGLAVMSE
jgi:hypothetical protein